MLAQIGRPFFRFQASVNHHVVGIDMPFLKQTANNSLAPEKSMVGFDEIRFGAVSGGELLVYRSVYVIHFLEPKKNMIRYDCFFFGGGRRGREKPQGFWGVRKHPKKYMQQPPADEMMMVGQPTRPEYPLQKQEFNMCKALGKPIGEWITFARIMAENFWGVTVRGGRLTGYSIIGLL